MKLKLATNLVAGIARFNPLSRFYQWLFIGKTDEIVGGEYTDYGTGGNNAAIISGTMAGEDLVVNVNPDSDVGIQAVLDTYSIPNPITYAELKAILAYPNLINTNTSLISRLFLNNTQQDVFSTVPTGQGIYEDQINSNNVTVKNSPCLIANNQIKGIAKSDIIGRTTHHVEIDFELKDSHKSGFSQFYEDGARTAVDGGMLLYFNGGKLRGYVCDGITRDTTPDYGDITALDSDTIYTVIVDVDLVAKTLVGNLNGVEVLNTTIPTLTAGSFVASVNEIEFPSPTNEGRLTRILVNDYLYSHLNDGYGKEVLNLYNTENPIVLTADDNTTHWAGRQDIEPYHLTNKCSIFQEYGGSNYLIKEWLNDVELIGFIDNYIKINTNGNVDDLSVDAYKKTPSCIGDTCIFQDLSNNENHVEITESNCLTVESPSTVYKTQSSSEFVKDTFSCYYEFELIGDIPVFPEKDIALLRLLDGNYHIFYLIVESGNQSIGLGTGQADQTSYGIDLGGLSLTQKKYRIMISWDSDGSNTNIVLNVNGYSVIRTSSKAIYSPSDAYLMIGNTADNFADVNIKVTRVCAFNKIKTLDEYQKGDVTGLVNDYTFAEYDSAVTGDYHDRGDLALHFNNNTNPTCGKTDKAINNQLNGYNISDGVYIPSKLNDLDTDVLGNSIVYKSTDLKDAENIIVHPSNSALTKPTDLADTVIDSEFIGCFSPNKGLPNTYEGIKYSDWETNEKTFAEIKALEEVIPPKDVLRLNNSGVPKDWALQPYTNYQVTEGVLPYKVTEGNIKVIKSF